MTEKEDQLKTEVNRLNLENELLLNANEHWRELYRRQSRYQRPKKVLFWLAVLSIGLFGYTVLYIAGGVPVWTDFI